MVLRHLSHLALHSGGSLGTQRRGRRAERCILFRGRPILFRGRMALGVPRRRSAPHFMSPRMARVVPGQAHGLRLRTPRGGLGVYRQARVGRGIGLQVLPRRVRGDMD